MPFDGTRVETPELRRLILIEALRAPLPETFTWDFGTVYVEIDNCGSMGCALGLACTIWPDKIELLRDGDDEEIGAFFGLDEDAVGEIFFNRACHYTTFSRGEITPATVADALERRAAE